MKERLTREFSTWLKISSSFAKISTRFTFPQPQIINHHDRFADHPALIKQLDLIEDGDQITHAGLTLEDEYTEEELGESLNIFHFDPDYIEHEKEYDAIRKDILGDSKESGSSEGAFNLVSIPLFFP